MAIGMAVAWCFRDAAAGAVMVPLLPMLGAKQGQDVYLAGQLLLSSTTNVHNTDLADILSLCHEPMSANAELNVLIY